MATQPMQPQDAGMTFDSSPVQQDTPVGSQAQTEMTFDSSPVKQATPVDQLADSRTPEEQAFLQKNPDYIYVSKDPKFPNRQEGIYHKNEAGLNDPEMEHHPVDLDLAKNTALYGAGSAAAVGGVAAAPGALGAVSDVAIRHLAGNVLPGMEHEAAKQALAQAVPTVLTAVKALSELGIGLGGVTYLIKALSGGGK